MGDADINVAKVLQAYGDAPPDWLLVLGQACDADSQAAIARRLKVSAAAVNQVLKGTYLGSPANLEIRVRGELMGKTLGCPVLGEISVSRCFDEQRRPYAGTNPLRVRLYRACQTCPNRRAP